MKKIFPSLFANEKLKETLGRDFLDHRHSHAYILEGADGTGKMTCALSCAAALSCERRDDKVSPLPCMECLSCRKIFGGISPDVEVLSVGDRKSIGVGAIRDLKVNLYVVPNDCDFRVYIIDDAELMTPEAQNALLISLEEPPPFVVFFLLTRSSQALLETIRSRSPIIRMEKLSPDRIEEFLAGREEVKRIGDRSKIREIALMSSPSAGLALELVRRESGSKSVKDPREEKRKHAAALCSSLINGERARILDCVRAFPKGRENVRDILLLCGDALRDVMVARCAPNAGMIFYANAEEAEALSRKTSAARVNSLFSAVDKYADLLGRNASEAIVTTLLSME